MTIRPISKAARLFRHVLGNSWSFVGLKKGSPFMSLATTPTTGAAKPSSWLLNNEPDLTPDQVWMVLGTPDHGRSILNGVAIADTAEQASEIVEEQYQWEPLVVVSETGLDEWIETAEAAPAYVVRNVFGHAGTRRFSCMFVTHDAQHPIRQA